MDLISLMNQSIGLIKRLREISKEVEDAEFKSLLVELSNQVAEAKLECVSLKEQQVNLREENLKLKQASGPKEKPIKTVYGCYKFENKEGMYCSRCYDQDGLKVLVPRARGGKYICPQCKADLH